jgi:uncharacterized membrane protein
MDRRSDNHNAYASEWRRKRIITMARLADYLVLLFLMSMVLSELFAFETAIPVWLNVGVCVVASGVAFLMFGRGSHEEE